MVQRKMLDCVFCKIRDGEIPSVKVAETGNCFAVMDVYPEARGHSLAIPKKHYEKPSEIPAPEFHELMDLVARIQSAVLVAGLGEGTDVVQHHWPFVPQGKLKVDHVHYHVVPRKPGDSLQRPAEPTAREELEKNAKLLEAALLSQ